MRLPKRPNELGPSQASQLNWASQIKLKQHSVFIHTTPKKKHIFYAQGDFTKDIRIQQAAESC